MDWWIPFIWIDYYAIAFVQLGLRCHYTYTTLIDLLNQATPSISLWLLSADVFNHQSTILTQQLSQRHQLTPQPYIYMFEILIIDKMILYYRLQMK